MSTDPVRPTRAEIAEQVRVVRAAQDNVDGLLAAAQPAEAPACEHHFAYRILGGQPISVGICQFCHVPNWADLAEQAARIYQWGRDEALAGKPGRDRLSAYDMPREDEQPAASSAPADQNLRDRIAQALREHYLCTNRDEADVDGNLPCRCGDWREPGAEEDDENDWDTHLADVALSCLPTPTGHTSTVERVHSWATSGMATANSEFCDGYREAQRHTLGLLAERPTADEAQQAPECGAELVPRTGTRPCILPAGHDGSHHQDQHTNRWPVEQQAGEGR